MKRYIIYILIALCTLIGGFNVQYGYSPNSSVLSHFYYQFIHASIFHLIGNAYCVYMFYKLNIRSYWWIIGYIVSVIASFIVSHPNLCTVGFSGCIYAVLGLYYNKINSRGGMILISLLLFIPINAINMPLHILCFHSVFFIGQLYSYFKVIRKDVRRFTR